MLGTVSGRRKVLDNALIITMMEKKKACHGGGGRGSTFILLIGTGLEKGSD